MHTSMASSTPAPAKPTRGLSGFRGRAATTAAPCRTSRRATPPLPRRRKISRASADLLLALAHEVFHHGLHLLPPALVMMLVPGPELLTPHALGVLGRLARREIVTGVIGAGVPLEPVPGVRGSSEHDLARAMWIRPAGRSFADVRWRVSTVDVAEMAATIEQGLSNLEAAIALNPPAVEAPRPSVTGRVATKRRVPAGKGRKVGRQPGLDATAKRWLSLRR